MAEESPIVMGRIAGPYGIRGWVHVVSFTSPPENLLEYRPWYLARDRSWQVTDIVEARRHGKGLVAKLPDCDDRDAAALLKGTHVGVQREQLPRPGKDEYYWHDLVGLRVRTAQGMELGSVDHLIETGANDVLVVRGERERLIPFIRGQVVLSIDLAAGEIQVDWDPEF
jgi:16S rRNA processing protein RimM